MGVYYDLSKFQNTVGHPIAISRILVFSGGRRITEHIQGILRNVSVVGDYIEIEQYLTFYDYMNGIRNVPSKIVKHQNQEFTLLSILQH